MLLIQSVLVICIWHVTSFLNVYIHIKKTFFDEICIYDVWAYGLEIE